MKFDISKLKGSSDIYKLMSQTIIPRPIAWIVTQNAQGIVNIAPFSYFTGLSSNPATVIVSIGHKSDGSPKDTLQNIRESKKCTICMVKEEDLEPMNLSATPLDSQTSEADEFNIPLKEIFKNFPPAVASTPVCYACTLNQEVNIGGSTIPIILNLEHIFVEDSIVTNKDRLTIEFKPVARVGRAYSFLGDNIEP